jgi:hypothetical protein
VICGSKTLELNGALDEIVASLRGAGVDAIRTETMMLPDGPGTSERGTACPTGGRSSRARRGTARP